MIGRRTFLSYAVAMVAGPLAAQKAIMEKGQAVVCEEDSVKCPLGHASCKVINKPMVIGNDSREYPDMAQLFDYHILRCDQCHTLFTRE